MGHFPALLIYVLIYIYIYISSVLCILPRLGRLFCRACYGLFRGREIGELLIIVKAWTKLLKIISCIFFAIGLEYILRMVLCH